MDKLISTAKKLNTFFKVIQVILTVILVTLIVCIAIVIAGLVFDLPPHMVGTGFDIVSISFMELKIAEGYSPDFHNILVMFLISMVLGTGCVVLFKIGVKYIKDILTPMSKGQPFNEIAARNMKKLALLSAIQGVLFNCIGMAERIALTHGYELDNLLKSEKVVEVNVNYAIDFSFLIATAVLLLMSYVFHYGAELQTLSDETL